MQPRLRCVLWLLAALCLEGLPARVGAAPEPPEEGEPTASSRVVFQTAIDQEPYIRWTNHIGSAAESVVHIRVTLTDPKTGATEEREGSGFVIRCDGFVLAPSALFSPYLRGADGTVTTIPVGSKRQRLSFAAADGELPPPQDAPHPRFFSEKRDFTVLKVNDLHLRSLPMLAPVNVRAGMKVRVVYGSPNDAGGVEGVSVAATVGTEAVNKGRIPFEGAPPRVPPGAVVVDAESGMAIGIVPGSLAAGQEPPPAPYFTTFADFHQISNAVALLPHPRARERSDDAAASRDDMVWVPGGPVALDGLLAKDYAALYGKWVACTPGFWIDCREVTNAEYREFLRATGYRPPRGWTDHSDLGWWRDLPVTGVSVGDAAAYAAWRGKRLVTPVEWARASLGAEARRKEYLAALHRAENVLAAQVEALIQEDLAHRQQVRERLRSNGVRNPGHLETPVTRRIQAEIFDATSSFHAAMALPGQLVPAGWREIDRSIFGVKDVGMNAVELLQPNFAHRPMEVTFKQLHALVDPVRTPRYYNFNYTSAALEGYPTLGLEMSLYIAVPRMPLLPRYFIDFRDRKPARIEIPAPQNGFRCAL